MKKRLFTDDNFENYTVEADKLSQLVCKTIEPIIKKYVNAGYSVHDIKNVIYNATNCSIFLSALNLPKKKKKL